MTLYIGDTRDGLRQFISAGVRARTCVTSPPYWGLRDYGVEGQLGLEPTPGEYVERMVEVFRLVRDVLTDDGTLWLNLGDSYAALRSNNGGYSDKSTLAGFTNANTKGRQSNDSGARKMLLCDVKPKDLVGIPWRVAFALQADGWYLRSDIIWHKPNPMPESVRDRPTKAHEYLFLFAKSARYYYNADAIAEPANADYADRYGYNFSGRPAGAVVCPGDADGQRYAPKGARVFSGTRNRRSVWTITTEPYAEAHFAVMPTTLVEPCIMAGSAPGDVVLDPFMGSGTVAQVAQNLGRKWIGCELNPEYARMVKRRTEQLGMELTA